MNLYAFVRDGIDVLGLGQYREGQDLDPIPDDGVGMGQHGERPPDHIDRYTYNATAILARLFSNKFPNASKHYLHYLANTKGDGEDVGDTLTVNVASLVKSIQGKEHLESEINDAMRFAWTRSGDSFTIVGTWTKYTINDGNDWNFAVGSYWAAGKACVKRSDTGALKAHFTFNFSDHYNWYPGLPNYLFGIFFTDEAIGRLHTAGLAKQFPMNGKTSTDVLYYGP